MKTKTFETEDIKAIIVDSPEFSKYIMLYCSEDCKHLRFDQVEQCSFCDKYYQYLRFQMIKDLIEQNLVCEDCESYCSKALNKKDFKIDGKEYNGEVND